MRWDKIVNLLSDRIGRKAPFAAMILSLKRAAGWARFGHRNQAVATA
jgi:hypothetical protein